MRNISPVPSAPALIPRLLHCSTSSASVSYTYFWSGFTPSSRPRGVRSKSHSVQLVPATRSPLRTALTAPEKPILYISSTPYLRIRCVAAVAAFTLPMLVIIATSFTPKSSPSSIFIPFSVNVRAPFAVAHLQKGLYSCTSAISTPIVFILYHPFLCQFVPLRHSMF